MTAATDDIATIRDAQRATVAAIAEGGRDCLLACGTLGAFRACCGCCAEVEGGVAIDPKAAVALGVSIGDTVTYVPR
jgi:arginine N-succinyltransferase